LSGNQINFENKIEKIIKHRIKTQKKISKPKMNVIRHKSPMQCPEGKYFNTLTRRCKKITKVKECPEGKEINPKSGRCVNTKNIVSRDCPEGKEINPKTGRCVNSKNIVSRDCPEGKEINYKTGRCITMKNKWKVAHPNTGRPIKINDYMKGLKI
jgi:hypothetical protein